jgi:hypothetical protein
MRKNKKEKMKMLAAWLAITALCVTFFSPLVSALPHDPTKPLVDRYGNDAGTTDEGGWGEVGIVIRSFDSETNDHLRIFFGIQYDLIIKPLTLYLMEKNTVVVKPVKSYDNHEYKIKRSTKLIRE